MLCVNSQVVDVRFVMDVFEFNNLNLKVIFHPGDSFEQHQSVFLRHLRHSSAEIRLPTPVRLKERERERESFSFSSGLTTGLHAVQSSNGSHSQRDS